MKFNAGKFTIWSVRDVETFFFMPAVELLPIHLIILVALRETTELFSSNYSTMIERNRFAREIGRQWVPGRNRLGFKYPKKDTASFSIEGMSQVASWTMLHEWCMRPACPDEDDR